MTDEQAKQAYAKLQAKMWKALEARRIAEHALDTLKYGRDKYAMKTTGDWLTVCRVNGVSESADIGDFMC